MNKVYQMVTDKIISELEKGVVPWRKPWKTEASINYLSRKPYKGINRLLLSRSGEYLTFKQMASLGGRLKEGYTSEFVVFYKMLEYEEKNDPQKVKKVPVLRYYKVYHLSDIEGIKTKIEPLQPVDPIESAEKIVEQFKDVPIIYGGDRACYSPANDTIKMPERKQFESAEEFYSTLFHEMIHSTGHISRLNRFDTNDHSFGSEPYTREELIAEVGSGMLCGVAGIEEITIKNSASYIDSWLSKLKNDMTLIIKASSKAQKACEYILKEQSQESIIEEEEVLAKVV